MSSVDPVSEAEVERLEDSLMLLCERYRQREHEMQILAREMMALQVRVSQAKAQMMKGGRV